MNEIIDAAEAKHRVDSFWRENEQRSLAEKVMYNIVNAAQAGRYSIYWNYALSRDVIAWLQSLGYKVNNIPNNEKNKYYKFLIRWDI